MKKLTTLFSTVAILSATLASGSALASSDQVMDPAAAHKDAVKTRLVHYTCQGNSNIEVTYGFNNVNHPTYASAKINGKKRFMPINYEQTDNMVTVFGDDNNFNMMTDSMIINNYNKVPAALVNSPSGEILYKDCKVDWTKKLKG